MLLLDTCAVLWLATDSTLLSMRARAALQEHRGALFLSAITAFEVAIKSRKGKLSLEQPPTEWYQAVCNHHGLRELPITGSIALRSVALPSIHSDPADRLIIATAQEHDLSIVTADPVIRSYPDTRCIW